MILSVRIIMFLAILVVLHLFYNINELKKQDKILKLIIWVYTIHIFIFIPISLISNGKYLYIENAAPIPLIYGPLLLLYYLTLQKKSIEFIGLLIHLVPIIIAFVFYAIFIGNFNFREEYFALYFKIDFLLIAFSFILYSIYILFLMKPKIEIDEMYYFCWFLLISGVVNIIVANNMPLVTNNEHAEILKSGGTQLIVYSFMSFGIALLFIYTFKRFKHQVLVANNKISNKIIIKNRKNTIKNKNLGENTELVKVKQFFNSKSICNSSINLKSVAKDLKITQSLLSTLIQQEYKLSFSKLLSQQRIDYACAILSNKKHKIQSYEKLAQECGFLSISTFYRNFKARKGMSPKEYRSKFSNNLSEIE